MKPRGRSATPLTEEDIKMVKEYIDSEKSLEEIARKYNTSKEGLRYKVLKYQGRLPNQKKQKDNS